MSRVFRGCGVLMAAVKETAKAAATKPAAAAKPVAPPAAAPKTAGIMKLVAVSPAMSKFVGGAPEASRTEVVKKIWDHIKLNNLQNPANKREIFCDDKLKTIFDGKDKIGMMEIAKLISPHFIKSN